MAKDNKGRFKVKRKIRNLFIQNEYELSLALKIILCVCMCVCLCVCVCCSGFLNEWVHICPTSKLNFIHYFSVIIIFSNSGLCKFSFSTCSIKNNHGQKIEILCKTAHYQKSSILRLQYCFTSLDKFSFGGRLGTRILFRVVLFYFCYFFGGVGVGRAGFPNSLRSSSYTLFCNS